MSNNNSKLEFKKGYLKGLSDASLLINKHHGKFLALLSLIKENGN
jgi:hypothetical protein